jgi:daunorubicin/doxorubicin transport system ATP-binding protein
MSNPSTDLAIEASGLVRSFGATRALDGIDLRVPAGAVYGLLGPNGAGKTTAVRVLATLLRPDGGEARVFGHDVVREADAVRGKVSLTGQFASVDEDLTGMENLVLLARLLGHRQPAARDRAAQLLAAFGLTEAADRQVKKYSGGMRRRLDVAASILNTPELLFLDEPTTGLDPRSRSQVWEIIRAVVAHGTTVLLTTQYLRLRDPGQRPDAERVLAQALDAPVQPDADPVALTARVSGEGTGFVASEQAARALAELARAGIVVDDFSLGQPSLDEVFLALTDRPAEPDNDEMEAA